MGWRVLYIVPLNILFWAFFIVSCLPLFCIAIPLKLFTWPFDPNGRALHQFSCFWGHLYILANPFWSVAVTGKNRIDRNKAYVIVCNHASMADILVAYASYLHFKWVSKRELFYAPFVGWNMLLNQYVAIKRGDPDSRAQCLKTCAAWLKKGSSVLFFPEGTRSPDGKLKPFKVGAFHLALENGFDILPMVIRGSRDAIPKHSVLLNHRSKMQLEILSPIVISDFEREDFEEGVTRLTQVARDVIAAALNRGS